MQISHSISYPSFKEGMNARSLLTGNEVKAFFVIPAWFHLTGQQVQSYRLPVRLKDRDREIDTDTHTHTRIHKNPHQLLSASRVLCKKDNKSL